MTEKQKYNFYLANLGPELGRLLKFKNIDELQFLGARQRVENILEKIVLTRSETNFLEIEKILDLILWSDSVSQDDLDLYFYPISLNMLK